MARLRPLSRFQTTAFRSLISALVAAALGSGAASAAEITAGQAGAAVGKWLGAVTALSPRVSGPVAGVDSFADSASGAKGHIVRLEGGGFVVTSADDRIEPVLAAVSGSVPEFDLANPFWALLAGDIAYRTRAAESVSPESGAEESPSRSGIFRRSAANSPETFASEAEERSEAARRKWAGLLEDGSAPGFRAAAPDSLDTVADVRVDPLVRSKWSQGTNDGYPSGNGVWCYNYYTPNHYFCGCTVTAAAQLMRYHRWPTNAVASGTYPCSVDGVARNMTMMGGVYDWDAMPYCPKEGVTEPQCQAIGRLTYDLGVSSRTAYTQAWSAGSQYCLGYNLTARFGYRNASTVLFSNAQTAVYGYNNFPFTLERFKKAVIPDCDAGLPVFVGISMPDGGGSHAVLADGYGYSGGTFYVHLNFGWLGDNDGWYAPPDFTTPDYSFTVIDSLIYNVFPTQDAATTVVSGRVLGSGGAPVPDAVVVASRDGGAGPCRTAVADARGIYVFFLPAGTYTLAAASGGVSGSRSVAVSSGVSNRLTEDGLCYMEPVPRIENLYGQDIPLPALETVAEPRLSPGDCVFYPSTNVAITCETPGATIRYTTDGSEPTEESAVYVSPFFLTDSVRIRAKAYKEGMGASLVASASYVCDGLSAALDTPGLSWTTDPDYPWTVETGSTKDGLDAAHSCFDNQNDRHKWTSWMQTTVRGPAKVSFFYRTVKYHALFYVDCWRGAVTNRVVEDSAVTLSQGWTPVDFTVPEGDHTVRFAYQNYLYPGVSNLWWSLTDNGAYVDDVSVTYLGEGADCPFELDPPDPGRPEGRLSRFDYVGLSDGAWHTIDTNQLRAAAAGTGAGAEVRYSLESNGVYAAEAPVFRDPCSTSVWYRISFAEYSDYVHEAAVILTNRTSYTICFDANGGTGSMPDAVRAYGESAGLPSNRFERAGYAFRGWSENPSASAATWRDGQLVANLAAESLTLYAVWRPELRPVYRFWSDSLGHHFYTISASEKTSLSADPAHVWSYEQIAYYAYMVEAPGTTPLYRFWSDRAGAHFYTASAAERDALIAGNSGGWVYETIAYYVYPTRTEGASPVYRFWSDSAGAHFYTISESEKNALSGGSGGWRYEGVSFYAMASVPEPEPEPEPLSETSASPAPVPYGWLEENGLAVAGSPSALYEAAALAPAANGLPVWKCYVAGLGPSDASARFLASISFSGGMPVVSWAPDLGTNRVYTVEGRTGPDSGEWTSPPTAEHRFFRVKVDLP